MVPGHLDHDAALVGGRHAESVPCPLDDQHRDGHGIDLRETTRRRRAAGPARRLQRECETKHPDRARRRRCAASNARAGGPPAGEERQAVQLAREQVVDHRGPRSIELMRGRGSTPSRDAVGLLDESDAAVPPSARTEPWQRGPARTRRRRRRDRGRARLSDRRRCAGTRSQRQTVYRRRPSPSSPDHALHLYRSHRF